MSFYRCLEDSYMQFFLGPDDCTRSVKVEMSDNLTNVVSEVQNLYEIPKPVFYHYKPSKRYGNPSRRRYLIITSSFNQTSEIDISPIYRFPDEVEAFLKYSKDQIVYQHRKYQGDNRMGSYWKYM